MTIEGYGGKINLISNLGDVCLSVRFLLFDLTYITSTQLEVFLLFVYYCLSSNIKLSNAKMWWWWPSTAGSDWRTNRKGDLYTAGEGEGMRETVFGLIESSI